MRADISAYRFVGRVLEGDRLQLIFEHRGHASGRKILLLKGVVGFTDRMKDSEHQQILDIREPPGSSYNMDLSVTLRRPEIIDYPEVILFADAAATLIDFRAVARTIVFRVADREKDKGFL